MRSRAVKGDGKEANETRRGIYSIHKMGGKPISPNFHTDIDHPKLFKYLNRTTYPQNSIAIPFTR